VIFLATIQDEGSTWKLTIYPEATPVEEINEPDRGYRALLGYDASTDRHMVMYVWYNKDKYPIGEVLKKIDEMKSCPRCDTLDKDRLRNITIQTQNKVRPVRQMEEYVEEVESVLHPQQLKSVPAPKPIVPRGNIKDMFANAMFDAYLTPAGKFMVGNVFGDDKLVESAMPKDQDELAQLWSDTTSGKLLRSPEDAKKFMSVLKSGSEEDDTAAKIKAKKVTQGIVIY